VVQEVVRNMANGDLARHRAPSYLWMLFGQVKITIREVWTTHDQGKTIELE
jgi:hypothetical protein